VSKSSDNDTDSTKESDSEFHSELDPDVDMRMVDDVNTPDGIDSDGDVDMERDGDDEVEEDEQDEDEEEEDEDDGKEPRTIGQGEMVNTSADDDDTMVDDQPMVLPEQCQQMREPRPQPPASAPRPQTPETHPLSGLEELRPLTPQKPRPAVPTLRGAEAARTTADVDVNQQLLIESAGGNSLSDVPLPNVPLPEIPLPEMRPDGSVANEWTRTRVAEEAMVVPFELESDSCLVLFLCSNVFISGIDYYPRREVFGSLKV
jgi:hypothetical protein